MLNSGLQFDRHEREGIEPIHFAEMLIVSGIVLLDNVKWLSFHSGYDFGYLLSMLTNQNLPEGETEFFETLKVYFPNVYDVKYLMKSCKNLKGGLQEVSRKRMSTLDLFTHKTQFCRSLICWRLRELDLNIRPEVILF